MCRVCGFRPTEPPWGDSGHAPTYGYCPCCQTQFGVNDREDRQIIIGRRQWVEAGFPWCSTTRLAPPAWEPIAQLRSIPFEFLFDEEESYLRPYLEDEDAD